MKKIICVLLVMIMSLAVFGCGDKKSDGTAGDSRQNSDSVTSENDREGNSDIDVDLTELSSTMVYSEVYNMMTAPDGYMGKTVKMKGPFSVYHDEETGNYYFACIISDATACCSQGIEFVLTGEHTYPKDYPELGTEITVTGIFDTYEENGYRYCRLNDAELVN
ncbi:MAG: hypothetical protein ACI3YE_01875 [Candidatus Avispirillum sp.]